MTKSTLTLILFTCFAFGLPIWAMQTNEYSSLPVHACVGECYSQWQQETGGLLALTQAKAEAKAAASPAELGQMAYVGCVACHGAQGEGGIGPQLSGQSSEEIAAKLWQYKNGETRGSQSALMWSQSSQLSQADIDNLAAYTSGL